MRLLRGARCSERLDAHATLPVTEDDNFKLVVFPEGIPGAARLVCATGWLDPSSMFGSFSWLPAVNDRDVAAR